MALNKQIKAYLFTRYSQNGASSRVRILQYAPYLSDSGIQVICSSLNPVVSGRVLKWRSFWGYLNRFLILLSAWLCVSNSNDRIAWIEKELFPFLPAWIEIRLLKIFNRVIYDIDDSIHLTKRFNIFGGQTSLESKLRKTFSAGDLVLCGNHYLRDTIGDWSDISVVFVPSCAPIPISSNIRDNVSQVVHDGCKSDQICWVGSPTTWQKYESFLLSVAKELVCIDSGLNIVIVGSGEKERTDAEFVGIKFVDWSCEVERKVLGLAKVGLMPSFNDEWDAGKCSYKMIQYMSYSVVPVFSPNRYSLFVADDIIDATENNPKIWAKKVIDLINNETSVREILAERLKSRFLNSFSSEHNSKKIINYFYD